MNELNNIPRLNCLRCVDKKSGEPYSWIPNVPHPKVCPNCHSPYWDTPRRKDMASNPQGYTLQYPQHEKQPVYQPPIQPHYIHPPQIPQFPQPPPKPVFSSPKPLGNREAVERQEIELADPSASTLDPDKEMPLPIRKCRICGTMVRLDQLDEHMKLHK